MTESEHIHQLYIIVSALAERIDTLERTRWTRLKVLGSRARTRPKGIYPVRIDGHEVPQRSPSP